tara:strand:+ start:34 stop:327 length:294 start_codon:yes stop_codon:yes gene_type:complete
LVIRRPGADSAFGAQQQIYTFKEQIAKHCCGDWEYDFLRKESASGCLIILGTVLPPAPCGAGDNTDKLNQVLFKGHRQADCYADKGQTHAGGHKYRR